MFGRSSRSNSQAEALASADVGSAAADADDWPEAASVGPPADDRPRLQGLPAEAARLLPYLQAEPPCSACGSVMTLQGRGQQPGPCNSCSTSSAAEPLGVCHMCLTCGRRLCAGCSQNEAVKRRTEVAMMSARRQAAEAADSWAAEAAESARKQVQASSDLKASQAQQASTADEAAAEQAAARAHKETLTSEIQTEREALDRQIAEAERQLEERDLAVRQARSRLRELQAELAAAPRPAANVPDDRAELQEARAEVARFRALANEREQQAAEHQAAAEQAVALEQRLRTELENLRVVHAEQRGKRLASLALARAELNVERLAAEEAVKTELAAAEAEEEARRQRNAAEEQRQAAAAAAAAEEQRQAAAAAAATAATAATSTSAASDGSRRSAGGAMPSGGEGVFDRFLGKLQNFVEDMDALVVPVAEDMAWGLPMEMQMGMTEYGYMTESSEWIDPTAFGESSISAQGPMDEEAQALHMERLAWERRRADCEKQLEWMRRDAERRVHEAEALRAEITRLHAEHASSRNTADELERDLSLEKERMRDYHRKMRNLLLRTVASCRGRILAALRSGNTLKTSELESLFDSDWVAPSPTGSSQSTCAPGDKVGQQISADADVETFTASLEAMCDELERAALDAGEDARNSGMLSDAVCAFNAAADAKEAAAEWPSAMKRTSSGATEDSQEHLLDMEDECAPCYALESSTKQAAAATDAEDWPQAAMACAATSAQDDWPQAASAQQDWPEAATTCAPMLAEEDTAEEWPEAVTSLTK